MLGQRLTSTGRSGLLGGNDTAQLADLAACNILSFYEAILAKWEMGPQLVKLAVEYWTHMKKQPDLTNMTHTDAMHLVILHLFDETFGGGCAEARVLVQLRETFPHMEFRFATRDEDRQGVDIIGMHGYNDAPVPPVFASASMVGIQVKPGSYMNTYRTHSATMKHRHGEHEKHAKFLKAHAGARVFDVCADEVMTATGKYFRDTLSMGCSICGD